MIKNNKGITLLTLVVSVIILFILIGTGTTAIYTNINEVKDNKLAVELGIVRQAIVQQYTAAAAVGQTKIPVSQSKVSFWVGERIDSPDLIRIPTDESDESVKSVDPLDPNFITFRNRLEIYEPIYQEDFYYRLNTEQLQKIGIDINMTDSKYTYIVNYSTGEVYNEAKKVNSESHLLYLPSIDYEISEQIEDNESFNDWNEKK